MKILWVVNVPLIEASSILNIKYYFNAGWINSLASKLTNINDIQLAVCFSENDRSLPFKFFGSKITYYTFSKLDTAISFDFIIKDFKPDIVHIHGTEYKHSLIMATYCNRNNLKFVISIQGVINAISKHISNNLPQNIIKKRTFRNFLLCDNINDQIRIFGNKSKNEAKLFQLAKFVIGRTDLDKAVSMQFNKNLVYFKNNEILRDSFYNNNFEYSKDKPLNILMTQGYSSIKGLHNALDAIYTLKKFFPNIILKIAGNDIFSKNDLYSILKRTSYASFIRNKINKLRLKDNVIFLGNLNENQIKEQYLSSKLFILPSSIENSPNSLGEAMLLGLPIVASFVGGIPSMVTHYENALLYQHDAPYMLAFYIKELVDDNDLYIKLSKNSIEKARLLFDKNKNTFELIEIYKKIYLSN